MHSFGPPGAIADLLLETAQTRKKGTHDDGVGGINSRRKVNHSLQDCVGDNLGLLMESGTK